MAKYKKRPSVYNKLREACAAKHTTISRALQDCGRSDSNTGQWKAGSFPRLDAAMDLAEHLGISLDELCYGTAEACSVILDSNRREWLSIIDNIPIEKHQMCKDFLKTHMVTPEKYENVEKRIS